MTTLRGRTPKDTFSELLKISQPTLDGALSTVETGGGVKTPLSLSETTVSVEGGIVETPVVLTSGSVTNGSLFTITLSANTTFTFPALQAGKQFTIVTKQDATGGRTVTWPASVKWSDAALAPKNTANAKSVYGFLCDGEVWLGFAGGLNF